MKLSQRTVHLEVNSEVPAYFTDGESKSPIVWLAKNGTTLRNMTYWLQMYFRYDIGLWQHQNVSENHWKLTPNISIYFFFYLFRRAANLPEVIVDAVFGDRPMTPVLQEAQQLVLPSLSQCYCEFHEVFDIIINLFECVVVPYFNNKSLYEESFDTCTGSQFMQVLFFSVYIYIHIFF